MDKYTKEYLRNCIINILAEHSEPITAQTIHSNLTDSFSEDEVKVVLDDLSASKRIEHKSGKYKYEFPENIKSKMNKLS